MNAVGMPDESKQGPAVTWLLSVKNGGRFLRETLQSIYAQTYRNHRILVWDDCSTDGTLEELQRWIPALIPGKIFSGRSLRLGASLAFLVVEAETELCARIDGDDINHPERLQRQVAYMVEHPEVGVLGSQTKHIDEHGHVCSSSWHYPVSDADIRWRTRWQASLCHPAVLFRRSAVLEAGNYRDFQIEDLDLWMRMSLITEIHNLAEPLLKYRRFNSSMTGQVEDFYPLDLKAATLNGPVLFGRVNPPERALDLWRATYVQRIRPSHFSLLEAVKVLRDRQGLRSAAVAFARTAGKPDDYFLKTDFCQEQLYRLRQKFFQSCGLAGLHKLRSRVPAWRSQAQSHVVPPSELQPKSAG